MIEYCGCQNYRRANVIRGHGNPGTPTPLGERQRREIPPLSTDDLEHEATFACPRSAG
jgi:hypothetical protein